MNLACEGQQRWHDAPFFSCGHASRQEIPHTPIVLTARLHYRPDSTKVFRSHQALGTMIHFPPQHPMTQGTLRFADGRNKVLCRLTRAAPSRVGGLVPAPFKRDGDGFRTATVSYVGTPIVAASWQFRYRLPGIPQVGIKPPSNLTLDDLSGPLLVGTFV